MFTLTRVAEDLQFVLVGRIAMLLDAETFRTREEGLELCAIAREIFGWRREDMRRREERGAAGREGDGLGEIAMNAITRIWRRFSEGVSSWM